MRPTTPLHRAVLGAALLALAALPVAADVTEESVETYSLAADGRVSVENVNGEIEVFGWDRDEVELTVVKTADRQEDLDRLEVRIDASAGSLHVTTRYPERRGGWWDDHGEMRVDYKLQVPRRARIDEVETVNGGVTLEGLAGTVIASTVNGGVYARDLGGDVDLSTVNGSIEAAFDRLGGDQRVDLSSVNGRVELEVPADADATFSAETVHGSLRDDFDFHVEKERFAGAELDGRLGSGAASVELETVNGSVRIRRR